MHEIATALPEWATAAAAVVGLVAGALASYMRLGDRLDRLEAQMEHATRTLERLENLVWSNFHPGRRQPPHDS